MIDKIFSLYSNQGGLVNSSIKVANRVVKPTQAICHSLGARKRSDHEEFIELIQGKTVAIVGNSPILDNSGYGEEIDGNDLVIRMNGGIKQSKLNKDDTGLRTDIWASGAIHSISDLEVQNSLKEVRSSLQAILVTLQDKPIGREGLGSLYVLAKFLFESKAFYCPHEILLKLLENIGANPSTGLRVIELLLENNNFSQLTLFGFSFDTTHRIYGPKRNGSVPMSHNFIAEKAYILDRILNHNVLLKT